jgi:hypothetical protein
MTASFSNHSKGRLMRSSIHYKTVVYAIWWRIALPFGVRMSNKVEKNLLLAVLRHGLRDVITYRIVSTRDMEQTANNFRLGVSYEGNSLELA